MRNHSFKIKQSLGKKFLNALYSLSNGLDSSRPHSVNAFIPALSGAYSDHLKSFTSTVSAAMHGCYTIYQHPPPPHFCDSLSLSLTPSTVTKVGKTQAVCLTRNPAERHFNFAQEHATLLSSSQQQLIEYKRFLKRKKKCEIV